MTKPGEKTLFEQRGKCPYCSKPIHTVVRRVTIIKAVPGQTTIEGLVEKDTQSTLEKDYQDEFSPPKKRGKRGKR